MSRVGFSQILSNCACLLCLQLSLRVSASTQIKGAEKPGVRCKQVCFFPLTVSIHLANRIVLHFYLVCNHDAIDYRKINV